MENPPVFFVLVFGFLSQFPKYGTFTTFLSYCVDLCVLLIVGYEVKGKVHLVIMLIWSPPQRMWTWVNTRLQD